MEEVCEGAKAVTAGRRSQSNALALRPLKLREPRHCLHIVHLTSHFHLYSSSSNLSTKLFHVNTPESATMAPSDEDRNPRDDTINPFIAFRRFADEQMSTIFNSVFGLHTPSSSSSPDRATKDYQAWLQEARESRDALDREAEEMGKIMDVYTRARDEQQEQEPPWDSYIKSMKEQQDQDNAQDDTQRCIRDDDKPLRCPYRPAEREVPVERFGQTTGFSDVTALDPFPLSKGFSISFPFDTFSMIGEQVNSSPITYLLFGPYSPVRLEQHRLFKDQDVHWREAFEDLLAVQSGREIGSKCTNRPDLSKAEWVREMIDMAVRQREEERDAEERQEAQRATSTAIRRKPGFLDRFADSRQPENDADEDEADGDFDEADDDDEDDDEEVTELDLYERFLDSKAASSNTSSIAQSARRSFAQLQHDSAPTATDSAKPSILSTLTTTERVTLPDGTVNTKVVLKKRFSDGREECTETVHTQNPMPQAQLPAAKVASNDKGLNQKEADEKKSKGWFWS